MRILFAGSPAIAIPALEAVFGLTRGGEQTTAVRGQFELAGLLTNPDSPRGRRGTPEPTELAAAAARLSAQAGALPVIPVLKPEKLDGAARELTAALRPDLLVSFAYGRIFGPKFLALFPLGGINIHPSLLPKYRGAAPIPVAILNRDRETGLTIQRLAPEMDSGDILAQERVPLTGRETTGELSEIMARKAAMLLPAVVTGIAGGTLRPRPQNHGEASYCALIAREEGLIDWSKSALEIDARIRAFDPWPLCRTTHGGQQLCILRAEPVDAAGAVDAAAPPGRVLGIDERRGILIQTGAGTLAVTVLQYQAKKALEWRAFLNGARDFIGSRLG
jgi:methionyl-tRNA formyltransferase